mmetsp:Transcript_93566/g.302371  ORF Transcript_93566/g.302371 Transcript_93566/m.302371 type:complete len:209 (-) Transcript_93566:896-1522(-)
MKIQGRVMQHARTVVFHGNTVLKRAVCVVLPAKGRHAGRLEVGSQPEQLREKTLLLSAPHNLVSLEALLGKPPVIEELAHVVTGGVGEEHCHALVGADVVLLDELVGPCHGGAAAAADHEAFVADDAAAHGKGLVVISLDPIVGEVLVKHRGNEVVADTLHMVGLEQLVPGPLGLLVHGVRLCEHAAVGVHANDLDTRDLLLELFGRA